MKYMTVNLFLNIAIIFNPILFERFLHSLIYVSHPSRFQYCTQLGSIIQYYIVLQFYSSNQN